MSSLLRRLAGRALGAAPAVRPVLAWSGAPLETPAPADALPIAPEAPPRREPIVGAPAPLTPERAALREVVRAVAPPTTGSPVAPLAPVIDSPEEPADEPAARPLASRQRVAAPRSAPRALEQRIDVRIEAAAPSAVVPLREPPGDPLPDAPQLLLPRRVGRALQPPAIAAAAAARTVEARRPVADDSTEVHVTIGRIEVTAVHEAPPPRREPSRARKPKPLAEHLALRQGRRT